MHGVLFEIPILQSLQYSNTQFAVSFTDTI
jgi:hypothetical protein